MAIRTVIVDDEPWARAKIASLLSTEPDFEVVRSCRTADDAIEAIATDRPQVVFLDVQLQQVDGFAVIEAIGVDQMPVVVFATAYDEYALRAFEMHALDYLLKPFDEGRFRRTLDRVRHELAKESRDRTPLRMALSALPPQRRYLQRVVVRMSGRVVFLKVEDIDWLEGAGNYVTLHVGAERYLLRDGLSALESKLDPAEFIRLHRSAIVNVDRIRQITPWVRGEQSAVLADGTTLTIGRMFRSRLTSLLTNRLG